MIVTRKFFPSVLKHFSASGFYGLDTETSGLEHSDKLFAVIVADEKEGFYFHFEPETPGAEKGQILPREWICKLQVIFDNPASIWAIHNARFDLKMLEKEGLHICGRVHCSQITWRLLENNRFSYSLAELAKTMGQEKDDAVEKYIRENKLFEHYFIPGKKQKKTRKFFWKVPFSILSKYAIRDAELHRAAGLHQLEKLKETPHGEPSLDFVYENEHRLLHVCTAMEETGIRINRAYVEKALDFEQKQIAEYIGEFEAVTETEFKDSNKALEKVFRAQGCEIRFTEKGNPSFAKGVLDELDSPLAECVRKIRLHSMYAGTYYSSFLHFADSEDRIHPEMRQDATETGRMSYHSPNLQNVPKEDDGDFSYRVRASFIPKPGACFVSIDYEQQEFKMLLDYAGEEKVIAEILGGKDVHQATADQMGISRKFAKTINFMLLYGGGVAKLAKALSVSVPVAQDLRNRYFLALPKVRRITRQIMNVGSVRGHIFNWAGRRCKISHPDFAYILVNHLIQGGCADVVKIAMVRLFDFLKSYRTKMVCQVHDEILFEVHPAELEIVPELKHIMESVYVPRNGLNLTCSVDHSWKSWGFNDKVKGAPHEARNPIQAKILSVA